MNRIAYRHTAYPSAWLAAASGFLYSISFVIVARNNPGLGEGLSGFFLLVGGVFGASALLGLYERLEPSAGMYAVWALVFGLAGSLVRRSTADTTSPSPSIRPTKLSISRALSILEALGHSASPDCHCWPSRI